MKPGLTLLSVAIAFAAGCQSPSPDTTIQSLTAEDVQTRLALERQTRGLKAKDATEVGRFSAHVTQLFEGVSAPIEYMRAQCPEKVLSAKTHPLYGLESPDASAFATRIPEGIAKHGKNGNAYTGDYVVLSVNGLLISLFPEGTKGVDPKGKLKEKPAKVLREISAVAALQSWEQSDKNGRAWSGVRLTAQASTPVAPPKALGDLIAASWKEPCK